MLAMLNSCSICLINIKYLVVYNDDNNTNNTHDVRLTINWI